MLQPTALRGMGRKIIDDGLEFKGCKDSRFRTTGVGFKG